MISRSCARGRTTTNPGPLAQGRPGSGGVKMGNVSLFKSEACVARCQSEPNRTSLEQETRQFLASGRRFGEPALIQIRSAETQTNPIEWERAKLPRKQEKGCHHTPFEPF